MLANTSSTWHRYPGAGPFQDDAVSHKTFFGREKETSDLASRVEVHRVTVVYGRSGLGKSSLLQAGLAPLLRESGYFPVFVRVNHADTSLTTAIADYTEAEAKRQGIEHVRGNVASSWEYFKTVELWDGDQLLVPVIILDQFEEIFSTGSEDQQDAIIEEVGMMARGKPPGNDKGILVELEEMYGSSSSKVQIIITIREDYLGHLEEIADEIPEIFDSRFRVTPLSLEAAKQALIRPAAVEGEHFDSPNFSIDEKLITRAIDYLTPGVTSGKKRRKRPGIEPFQLQLIGRRIEETAKRIDEQAKIDRVTVSFGDVGGDDGLTRALGDFYTTALAGIDGWRNRRKIKSLCLHHLISPDGKRQSLDGDAIKRLVGLKPEILGELVERRLLRIDIRADTKYYELSHDTLVEPILASQGFSVKYIKYINLYLWGSLTLSTIIFAFLLFFGAYTELDGDGEDEPVTGFIALLSAIALTYLAKVLFHRMQLNYKANTRLKRLLKLNDRSQTLGSKFNAFFLFVFLVCIGIPVVALGIFMVFAVLIEFPGGEVLYLDRFVVSLGLSATIVYMSRHIMQGFRKVFGVVIFETQKESKKRTFSESNARKLRLLSSIFLLLAIVVSCLPFTAYLDCNTALFQSFSDSMATMRMTDLSAWCEKEQFISMEDLIAGIVLMLLVVFGLYRARSYLVQRFLN